MPQNKLPSAPRWDLESIFAGGSGSTAYAEFRQALKDELAAAGKMIANLPETVTESTLPVWVEFILKLQKTADDIELVGAFAGCLTSQNVDDAQAQVIEGEWDVYDSDWKKLKTELEARFLKVPDADFEKLVQHTDLQGIQFFLKEMREIARSKMALELESFALDLGVNGFQAWNRLYDKMAGDLKVDFEVDGQTKELSMGQIATKMSDADRSVRRRAFEAMTSGWSRRENLAAMTLNAIAGFRLSLYEKRGWKLPHHESLVDNRVQKETVDAMWRVIRELTPQLKPYIEAKKKLLGIDKYTWYDEMAPVGAGDELMSFEQGGKFAVEQARGFSTDMAEFMEMALAKNWVEAEDRAGKAGGAFCTGMGPNRQSRVFMTYAGTFENMLTLAHELGHAYHSWVLNDKPVFAGWYPSCLAETASIFSETVVVDAAMKQAKGRDTKLMLLDQKLQAAYGMFCDLHCRYLFEKDFYSERANGVVAVERLKELMVSAQERTHAGMLDQSGYHPLFWCSKLHFYLSDQPFYNWPYTFGYLFAGGVYDRAQKEGSGFADKYRALLSDSGSMSTEDVARKHLGVDLTKDEFWTDAVNRSLADVDEFVKLVG